MAKLEQIFALVGLIAITVLYCIGSYYILWLLPTIVMIPLGALLFSLLGFAICRVFRKSF